MKRGPLNGLIAIAALVGVFYLGKYAYEHQPTDTSAATTQEESEASVDPAQVAEFYDEAVRQIEDKCGQWDKRCEGRIKHEVAEAHGIPEDQADALFLKERLRRGRQGR